MPESPLAGAASRKWAAEDDWERHRATIARLYETMTLAELKEYMEVNHGLSATNKMYKTRFKRWGLWKYTRAADIPQILKAKTERVGAEHKPTEVYLNGKRVDLDRVERYLRRRGSIRRQVEAGTLTVQSPPASSSSPANGGVVARKRPPDSNSNRRGSRSTLTPLSPASTVSLVSPVSPASSSSPTYLFPPASLRIPEDTYRAIRDYYDGCFSGGRWVSMSPVDERVFLANTETGALQDGNKQLNEFHQRFKLAFRLLQAPAQTGPEGMKMTRVCFAELPSVLAGEDPTMLYCVLDIVRRLREAGMDFLAVQLLQYLDGLSAMKRPDGGRHAMASIWRNLLLGLEDLGQEQMSHCAQIAASRFGAHLGKTHIKTLEAKMWSMFLSGAGPDEREVGLREMYASQEALPGFDYRNLVVACDLANLLRKREGTLDEASEVLTRVLDDTEREAVLRGFPAMAYNFISVLGKIRIVQGRLEEAEELLRDAVGIARRNRADDDSDLLDGLVYLEKCLRQQGREGEADEVLAEREGVVRESLERVGEKENAV